jgi:hypothetical protein
LVSRRRFSSEEGPDLISRFAVRRRTPVARDRYRALARAAGVPRPARSRGLDAAIMAAVVLSSLVFLPRVGAGVAGGAQQLVDSIAGAIPLLQGRATIDLPAGGAGTVIGAAPVADNLPQFTRDPELQLTGRVPSFAVQPGRTLQIVLNGAVIGTNPLDQTGAFNATIALKDGPNTLGLVLAAAGEALATSSYTVTLDRTAPTLTLARPQAGATVDAQNIILQGTTELGSTISVNGHTVVVSPEGAFSDFLTATPGPVTLTIVARDRAGNEATQKVSVIAQQTTAASGPTILVTLDRTTVRPGQSVLATITLRDATGPKVGVQVTLSVGVVFIGAATTDTTGATRIAFAAPPNEGEASVVVLGGGVSGRATLTVSAR